MKALAFAITAALFLSGCGSGIRTVARPEFNPAGRMAVMPFSGSDDDVGLSLAEAFTTYLMEAGFDMIERAQIERILKEQRTSRSGAFDTDTLMQIGTLANVDVIVTGAYRTRREEIRTVTQYSRQPLARPGKLRRQAKLRPLPGNLRIEINTVFSGLTVKFVDVGTGRVLMSSSSEKEYNADSINRALADMAESIRKTQGKKKGGE